jgi:hypothetical protein
MLYRLATALRRGSFIRVIQMEQGKPDVSPHPGEALP